MYYFFLQYTEIYNLFPRRTILSKHIPPGPFHNFNSFTQVQNSEPFSTVHHIFIEVKHFSDSDFVHSSSLSF